MNRKRGRPRKTGTQSVSMYTRVHPGIRELIGKAARVGNRSSSGYIAHAVLNQLVDDGYEDEVSEILIKQQPKNTG